LWSGSPLRAEPIVDKHRIDERLAKTKLAGLGETFLAEGSRFQVDPRLVVSIAGAESSFGRHICTPFNAWNWFWEGPCPPFGRSPFVSWDRGVFIVSKFLRKSYLLKGYTTIPSIGTKYCAEGCTPWEGNVTSFYTGLGGDVSDLTYAHGVPSETPTPPVEEKTPPVEEKTPPAEEKTPPTEKKTAPAEPDEPPPAEEGPAEEEEPVDEDPTLPPWIWIVLSVILAALIGAGGFALGRLTRRSSP
jgi:hypothetical protein